MDGKQRTAIVEFDRTAQELYVCARLGESSKLPYLREKLKEAQIRALEEIKNTAVKRN